MLEKNKTGIWIPKYLFRIFAKGVISAWLPKFAYKKPWKYLPWFSKKVKDYEKGRAVVVEKHKL